MSGLLNMINGERPLLGKKIWSNIVWYRVWDMEDACWKLSSDVFHGDRNLLKIVVTTVELHCRYLSWRRTSDKNRNILPIRKRTAKIVSRASKIGDDDDYHFNDAPMSSRVSDYQSCTFIDPILRHENTFTSKNSVRLGIISVYAFRRTYTSKRKRDENAVRTWAAIQ